MRKFPRLGRVGVCLAASLVIFGLTGCAAPTQSRYESCQFQRAVEELVRTTHRQREQAVPAASHAGPSDRRSKPTEAVKDSDERHPSRWKRKLKAAYA